MESKIRRSLKAVGDISSKLSSTNWELINTSASFLSLRDQAQKLKDTKFGPGGGVVSHQLIDESLDACRDLLQLSRILSSQ